MQYIQMFGASFVYVLLRSLQQRNIAFDNFGWILPVSYLMAGVDMFVIAFLAQHGWHWQLVLSNGTGAAIGAISAMFIHRRWIK